MDVTETTDIEDIKDVDAQSEEGSDGDREGDNTDVKMELEEKKGWVSLCTSLWYCGWCRDAWVLTVTAMFFWMSA